VGEEAAALCMNFIVKSREDMAFGAGLVALDIVNRLQKPPMQIRMFRMGSLLD
jgi:hypothetical protein